MQIGLDISLASLNQAGSGIYTRQLARALVNRKFEDEFHFFFVNQRRDMSARKTFRTRSETLYRDLIWIHLQLPVQARRTHVDLLHLLGGIIPFRSPCATVLTIFDTTIYKMPSFFPKWQWLYFQLLGSRSAKKSKHILTISDQSKRDIVSQFDVKPEKVTVTYLAAASEFKLLPTKEIRLVKRKYELDHFILTVGTVEPRKNLIRLLEAFAKMREFDDSYQLIHAGPWGWQNDELNRTMARLDLQNSVRFLGKVSLADLVGLYNAADLFVYPSIYEGFGLPVLEAMACGCPVITSNISSLPEVAGDAALMVDPYDIGQITQAMETLSQDITLRRELANKGVIQASRFTWEKCAQETLAVYREVLG